MDGLMPRTLKDAIDEAEAAPQRRKRKGRATLRAETADKEPADPNKHRLPDDEFLKTAIERADEAYQREKDNIAEAYEDLDFLAGNQWPEWAKKERAEEDRP